MYLGRQRALRLLGTSCKVDAHEALSLGLIDGIVSALGNNDTTTLQKDEVRKFMIDISSTPYKVKDHKIISKCIESLITNTSFRKLGSHYLIDEKKKRYLLI